MLSERGAGEAACRHLQLRAVRCDAEPDNIGAALAVRGRRRIGLGYPVSQTKARAEALPVTRKKGETEQAWARRVLDAWFRIGQPPLIGNPAEQVHLAHKVLGMPSAYGPGQEMGTSG